MAATDHQQGSAQDALHASQRDVERKLDRERRARALTWALSAGFEKYWAETIAPPLLARGLDAHLVPRDSRGRAITHSRRVVLAMLAWFADDSGYAWPRVEKDLVERCGLSHTTVAEVLRWYRGLDFGAKAKPRKPLRKIIEQIGAACRPSAGSWRFETIASSRATIVAIEAKSRKTGDDRYRLETARGNLTRFEQKEKRLNDLTRALANVSTRVRGPELIVVARDVAAWVTEVIPLLGAENKESAELGRTLAELGPALADFEGSKGVEHRRHGAPTYVSHAHPPASWPGTRGAIYAWARGLELDDGARLVLHAIISWTTGRTASTWRADAALAKYVGLSLATWKRALKSVRTKGFVTTTKIRKGGRLPDGTIAQGWATVHQVNWQLVRTAAAADPETQDSATTVQDPPDLSLSGSGPEPLRIRTGASQDPDLSQDTSEGSPEGTPERPQDGRARAHEGAAAPLSGKLTRPRPDFDRKRERESGIVQKKIAAGAEEEPL